MKNDDFGDRMKQLESAYTSIWLKKQTQHCRTPNLMKLL